MTTTNKRRNRIRGSFLWKDKCGWWDFSHHFKTHTIACERDVIVITAFDMCKEVRNTRGLKTTSHRISTPAKISIAKTLFSLFPFFISLLNNSTLNSPCIFLLFFFSYLWCDVDVIWGMNFYKEIFSFTFFHEKRKCMMRMRKSFLTTTYEGINFT